MEDMLFIGKTLCSTIIAYREKFGLLWEVGYHTIHHTTLHFFTGMTHNAAFLHWNETVE